jgi:predicted AAA+ superfamily ATPase
MQEYPYRRPVVKRILQGFGLEKRLLHIITGPRQAGKTTAATQIADQWDGPVVNATADLPLPPGPEWIRAQWNLALSKAGSNDRKPEEVLLILDEVQKVRGWSEAWVLLTDLSLP